MTRVKPGHRQRTRAPKVRTGCGMCKLRRLKCDETKPACVRCTSSNRICDGYVATAKSSSPLHVASMLHISPPCVLGETRSLQFFVEQTIQQLGIYFADDLWSHRVLQVAHSEPCIWHALVALSTYHERYLNYASVTESSFALRHYNKAIEGLSKTQHDTPLAHLVSCMIFICIEILRGHLQSAANLIISGCRMIRELRPIISENNPFFDLIEAYFSRLAVQVTILLGDIIPGLLSTTGLLAKCDEPTPQLEQCFEHLAGAREDIHDIVLEWMRHESTGRATHLVVERFERWCQAFDSFIVLNHDSLTSAADRRALALLKLHRLYLRTHVAVHNSSRSKDPHAWDPYHDEFNEMVDLAEASMQLDKAAAALKEQQPWFHMDTGATPIIFGIIRNCRDPSIRRRAMSLVLSNPMQEGMWNNIMLGKVAQRLVALEENGLSVSSCQDVPAETRVGVVSMHFGVEERHMIVRYWRLFGCWQEVIDSQMMGP